MAPPPGTPDTIVLVHGFWVTPRSWEDWIAHYEEKGYKVLAPAYPGFEVEVEALNADPTPIAQITVPQIIERFESVIDELDAPPFIIGHSAGGAFTQILLDHGRGAAGVALNSAPTEGVRIVPPSQVKSTFPVLKSPANRHKAVGFTPEQFAYAFTNSGFTEAESKRLYERYAIPASGGILWGSVLANFEPGRQDVAVDYHNEDRAPTEAVGARLGGEHGAGLGEQRPAGVVEVVGVVVVREQHHVDRRQVGRAEGRSDQLGRGAAPPERVPPPGRVERGVDEERPPLDLDEHRGPTDVGEVGRGHVVFACSTAQARTSSAICCQPSWAVIRCDRPGYSMRSVMVVLPL